MPAFALRPHADTAGLEEKLGKNPPTAGPSADSLRTGLEELFQEVGDLLNSGAAADRIAEKFFEPLWKSHRDSEDSEYRMEFLRRLEDLLREIHPYGPGKEEAALERLKAGLIQATQTLEESLPYPYRGIAIRRFEPVIGKRENRFTVLSTYTTGRPSFVTETGMAGIHATLTQRAGDPSLTFAEVGTGHGFVSAWVAATFPNEGQVFALDRNFRSKAALKVNALLNFSPEVLKKIQFLQANVAPEVLPFVDHLFLNPNQRPGTMPGIPSVDDKAASGYYRDDPDGDGLTLVRQVIQKWSASLREGGSFLFALVDWHDPERLKRALQGDGTVSQQIPGVGNAERYGLSGVGPSFEEEDLDNFTAAQMQRPPIPFQFKDAANPDRILNALGMADHLRLGGKVLVAAHVYQVSRDTGLEEALQDQTTPASSKNVRIESFTDAVLENAADRRRLKELFSEFGGVNGALRPPTLSEMTRHRNRNPLYSLIARHPATGDIIGFAAVAPSQEEPDALYMPWFLVERANRRTGIGTQLMEAVFAAAGSAAAFSKITWDTPRSNENGLDFYRSLPGVVEFSQGPRFQYNVHFEKLLHIPTSADPTLAAGPPAQSPTGRAGLEETDSEGPDRASDERMRESAEAFLGRLPDVLRDPDKLQEWWKGFGQVLPDLVQVLETGAPEDRRTLLDRLAKIPPPGRNTDSYRAVRGFLRRAIRDSRKPIRQLATVHLENQEQEAWRGLLRAIAPRLEGAKILLEYEADLMEGVDALQLVDIETEFLSAASEREADLQFVQWDARRKRLEDGARRVTLLKPESAGLFRPGHLGHRALAFRWSHRKDETRLWSRAFGLALVAAVAADRPAEDDPTLAALQAYFRALGTFVSVRDLQTLLAMDPEDIHTALEVLRRLTIQLTATPLQPLLVGLFNEFLQDLRRDLSA